MHNTKSNNKAKSKEKANEHYKIIKGEQEISLRETQPKNKLQENVQICALFASLHIIIEIFTIFSGIIPSDKVLQFIFMMLPLNILLIGTLVMTVHMRKKFKK